MCVEIRGVTSVGKDRCRYLSQFYLGDLERSWGTLIDILINHLKYSGL